jgi:hypothetical protein
MPKINESDRFDRVLCRKIYYHDLYDSLFDTTAFDAKKRQNITLSCKNHASALYKLECFVEDLLSNQEPPFKPRPDNAGSMNYDQTFLSETYFKAVPDFIQVVNALSPKYEYSERINVFISCAGSMGLLGVRLDWNNIWMDPEKYDPRFNGASAADIFNHLANGIRSEWKVKGLQAKLSKRKAEANERYVDYCNYVDSLFAEDTGRARLIVLRIDLYYDKQYAKSKSAFDIRDDLNSLLARTRHKLTIFGGMEGYIAKLEYGVDKGFHWHTIFFFDGSERKGPAHCKIAKDIGEYWKESITNSLGDYWNINNNADHYDRLDRRGIGIIHWYDTKLISNLKEHVLGYLCKMDQFIKPKLDFNPESKPSVRLMRRGDFPKKRTDKLGRPRVAKGKNPADQ